MDTYSWTLSHSGKQRQRFRLPSALKSGIVAGVPRGSSKRLDYPVSYLDLY